MHNYSDSFTAISFVHAKTWPFLIYCTVHTLQCTCTVHIGTYILFCWIKTNKYGQDAWKCVTHRAMVPHSIYADPDSAFQNCNVTLSFVKKIPYEKFAFIDSRQHNWVSAPSFWLIYFYFLKLKLLTIFMPFYVFPSKFSLLDPDPQPWFTEKSTTMYLWRSNISWDCDFRTDMYKYKLRLWWMEVLPDTKGYLIQETGFQLLSITRP